MQLQLHRRHNAFPSPAIEQRKPRCRCSHDSGRPLKQVTLISTPHCLWNLLTAEHTAVWVANSVVARQRPSVPTGGWCRTTLSECAGHLWASGCSAHPGSCTRIDATVCCLSASRCYSLLGTTLNLSDYKKWTWKTSIHYDAFLWRYWRSCDVLINFVLHISYFVGCF